MKQKSSANCFNFIIALGMQFIYEELTTLNAICTTNNTVTRDANVKNMLKEQPSG